MFESEEQAVRLAATLKENGVLARRYFYPSLESVECLGAEVDQPVSKEIASRILCLPIYSSLSLESIDKIAGIVTEAANG